MISHKHRCIFIHIQRCAGTSVETWLHGRDWWLEDKETKHLLASQAQRLYAEHWDSYFKFAIVRDPYTRVLSCLKYKEHFGIVPRRRKLDFTQYHKVYGGRRVIEFDNRFYRRADVVLPHHQPRQVYGNILDVPLDFIARFETLEDDMREVQKRLGVAEPFAHHSESSPFNRRMDHFEDAAALHVARTYAADFRTFGYPLEPPN